MCVRVRGGREREREREKRGRGRGYTSTFWPPIILLVSFCGVLLVSSHVLFFVTELMHIVIICLWVSLHRITI